MSEIIVDHNTNVLDLDVAKTAAEYLNDHYAGWLWATHCSHGLLHILNLNMEEAVRKATMRNHPWGMILKVDQDASGSEFKRRVLMAGGELLERSFQVVGRNNDAVIHRVDMTQ